MAISTYSELQTAVANWLHRSDLTERIKEFITLGEARINRDLRIRAMETLLQDTVTSGTRLIAVPADFIDARTLTLTANPLINLNYITPEQMDTRIPGSTAGQPKFFTIIGSNIKLGPAPSVTYTYDLVYYAKFPALSVGAPTNWLTANAPDLLLYAALLEAEPFIINDPRLATWGQMYDRAKDAIGVVDQRSRFGGSSLQVRLG